MSIDLILSDAQVPGGTRVRGRHRNPLKPRRVFLRTPPRSPSWYAAVVIPATLTLVVMACGGHGDDGGGGGGGGPLTTETEPNDTTATADDLSLGLPGTGSVGTAGDVDCWRLSLTGDQVIKVELFGVRFDQAGWDGNANVPRLTLIASDGTSKLLEHDYGGFTSGGWALGFHDLDFPCFRVPSSGIYFVCITQDDQSIDGGGYAVVVNTVSVGSLQVEAEAEGATGVNDSFGTAQAITPGTIRGWHVDTEDDYYAFTITGATIVTFEMQSYRNGVFGGDDEYFDAAITLLDTDGLTALDNNDDVFFLDSAIHYKLSAAGTYFLLVEEAGGAGDARYFLTFTSTAAAATAESEPNDTFATADAIAYGDLASGAMDVGDLDFFSFSGTAGDMVRVELFDAENSDAVDFASIEFIRTDGITLLPSDGFSDLQFLNTILQTTGTFYVRIAPDGSPAPTSYCFRLTRFQSAAYETEPNDTEATADLLDAGGRAAGVIDTAGDFDTFSFAETSGRLVTIVVYAGRSSTSSDGFEVFSGHGSDLDPVLTIKDALGTTLATSTVDYDSTSTEGVVDGLPTAQVSFVAPSSGTYCVEVTDAFGGFSSDSYYVIEKK